MAEPSGASTTGPPSISYSPSSFLYTCNRAILPKASTYRGAVIQPGRWRTRLISKHGSSPRQLSRGAASRDSFSGTGASSVRSTSR